MHTFLLYDISSYLVLKVVPLISETLMEKVDDLLHCNRFNYSDSRRLSIQLLSKFLCEIRDGCLKVLFYIAISYADWKNLERLSGTRLCTRIKHGGSLHASGCTLV